MRDPEPFDLVVVGGGKAGKTLAMDRARAGQRVAMVERGMIGGSCINVACIPTKALLSSARRLRAARQAHQLGLEGPEPVVSLAGLRAHKEGVVDGMVALNREQFDDAGLELLLGEASFVGDRTVVVSLNGGGERVIRGQDVLVNTGLVPVLPPIEGLAAARPLTSDSLLRLSALPASLLVIGGGVIGAEFASMLATFGVKITVIEGGPQLLGREDADIADFVAGRFAADGIDLRLGAKVVRVDRQGDQVHATLAGGEVLSAAELLVAVGRAPDHSGLNLPAAGIEVDARGFVKVDEQLRSTSAPGVWAAGDVAGSPQFTHVSWDDYRVVKANLAGGDRTTQGRLIAYTVFVTPELGRVGLTETAARDAGHTVEVARLDVAAIPRARVGRDTVGLWKAVIDARTDRILGAALCGPEAGEVITAVQMAMRGGLTAAQVRDTVISHPTMGEGLNLLFAAPRG